MIPEKPLPRWILPALAGNTTVSLPRPRQHLPEPRSPNTDMYADGLVRCLQGKEQTFADLTFVAA
jgi:hypothetical protein